MDRRLEIEADICVVGAGMVGLAHALEARARGLKVVVLERDARAMGASVRNFGHGCLAAMGDGAALDCALASRERWIELAPQAGLDLRLDGTVLIARSEDELEAITQVAGDGRRGATVIDPPEVSEIVPIPTEEVLGALYARLDFRINPRAAVAGLAGLLERDPDSLVVWEAPVHSVQEGVVHSARAAVHAPLIVLCPGPAFGTLPPELHPEREGLTLCKLHMLRVAPPAARRYGAALMTGLSLLRYPAFAAVPGAEAVRRRITAERPELVEAGIHLIVTQLPDGDLIIGDSHDYGATPSPFLEERVCELLLGEATRLLGSDRLEVRERWQGIYPVAPGEPFLVQERLDGVWVIEVVSGIGMTTSLGLAQRTLEALQAGGEPRLDGVSRPRADRSGETSGAPRQSEATRAGYGS
jgi:FAD dependent oxidoreductase TIGR03364